MKRILTAMFCLSLMSIGTNSVLASEDVDAKMPQKPPAYEQRKRPPKPVDIDELLNLTDEQKAQAKANRIKGRKEMKPIMDEIHAKREAILDVIDSDLSKDKQQEQISKLQSEIKVLSMKANEIREKNMNDFEKILTKEQKTKLEKFKKEHKPPQGCSSCKRTPPPPPMPDAD